MSSCLSELIENAPFYDPSRRPMSCRVNCLFYSLYSVWSSLPGDEAYTDGFFFMLSFHVWLGFISHLSKHVFTVWVRVLRHSSHAYQYLSPLHMTISKIATNQKWRRNKSIKNDLVNIAVINLSSENLLKGTAETATTRCYYSWVNVNVFKPFDPATLP